MVLSKNTEAPARRAEGTQVRKRVKPPVLSLDKFFKPDSYFRGPTLVAISRLRCKE